MRKSFFKPEVLKWLWLVSQIAKIVLLISIIIMVVSILFSEVHAEEESAYAICMNGDVVNIRSGPKNRAEWIGWLEPGDEVTLDGRKRNGFVHCINMNTESGEGWVFAGYLTYSKPELIDSDATVVSNGRLAARKYVDGKRTKWLKSGTVVHIYYMSDDWCSTNYGYIQTKFLQTEE